MLAGRATYSFNFFIGLARAGGQVDACVPRAADGAARGGSRATVAAIRAAAATAAAAAAASNKALERVQACSVEGVGA